MLAVDVRMPALRCAAAGKTQTEFVESTSLVKLMGFNILPFSI